MSDHVETGENPVLSRNCEAKAEPDTLVGSSDSEEGVCEIKILCYLCHYSGGFRLSR